MSVNEADFVKNERPDDYEVRFRVEGEIRYSVKAGGLEEAKVKATEMLEGDEFGIELDEVTYADIDHVWKSPAMFLVTRDGRAMQVSHLKEGDLPRQPDTRGF